MSFNDEKSNEFVSKPNDSRISKRLEEINYTTCLRKNCD